MVGMEGSAPSPNSHLLSTRIISPRSSLDVTPKLVAPIGVAPTRDFSHTVLSRARLLFRHGAKKINCLKVFDTKSNISYFFPRSLI